MRTEEQTRERGDRVYRPVSRMSMRFSLFGGGVAWSVHIFAASVIGEFGCRAGWGDWLVGGISMVSWLVLGVTLFSMALVLGAILTSLFAARSLQGERSESPADLLQSQLFIAQCSLITNGVFAFIILVQAVPIFFYFRAC